MTRDNWVFCLGMTTVLVIRVHESDDDGGLETGVAPPLVESELIPVLGVSPELLGMLMLGCGIHVSATMSLPILSPPEGTFALAFAFAFAFTFTFVFALTLAIELALVFVLVIPSDDKGVPDADWRLTVSHDMV